MEKRKMKRAGKFFLTTKTGTGAIAAEIFAGLGFVPYRVEYLAMLDKFEYIGESHLFEPIAKGEIAPEYEITVSESEDPNDDSIIVKAEAI